MSNKTETNITLERIKELKGNDSQEVFAQKIHTTQSNISKMLKGMTPPSAATLTELAKTYHVSVDWLLGLSDEKETGPKVQSHKLTVETVTYADAMAVLEVLYQKGSINVGYDNNGYNSEPDPSTIYVRDQVLAYFWTIVSDIAAEVRTFMHEYCHFIQDVSTTYGYMTYICNLQELLIKLYLIDFEDDSVIQKNRDFYTFFRGYDEVKDSIIFVNAVNIQEDLLYKTEYKEDEWECVTVTYNGNKEFVFGGYCIAESMAYLSEKR